MKIRPIVATLFSMVASVPAAFATATNVAYVSGTSGSDIAPCTLTLPCRTINGATSHVLIGGTIIVLDWMDVSLDHSTTYLNFPVTVEGGPHGAIITAPNGQPGISITLTQQSGAFIVPMVTLRNLTIISGTGANSTGVTANLTGAALNIENVNVIATDQFGFPDGVRVFLDPSSQANFKNVSVAGGSNGIALYPLVAAPSGPFYASIDHVVTTGCAQGLWVQDGNVTVRNSIFRDGFGGALFISASSAALATNSLIVNTQLVNNSAGLQVDSPNTVRLSESIISGNLQGVKGTGTIVSFRNNVFAGNGSDGTVSLSTSLK